MSPFERRLTNRASFPLLRFWVGIVAGLLAPTHALTAAAPTPSPIQKSPPRANPKKGAFTLGLVGVTGTGLNQPQFATPFGTLIATPGMILGGGPAAEIGPLSAELLYLSRSSSSATTAGVQFGAGSTASIHIPVMGRIPLSERTHWGAGAYYEMSLETGGSATLGLVTGPRHRFEFGLFVDARLLFGLEKREGADRNPLEAQLLIGMNFL